MNFSKMKSNRKESHNCLKLMRVRFELPNDQPGTELLFRGDGHTNFTEINGSHHCSEKIV